MDKVKNNDSSEIIKHEKKRERSVNFTQEETDLLVSLAWAKKHIIENKKSGATTWQDKEKSWKEIEKAFNSSSGAVYRDYKQLKLKYEGIKRDIRKKSAIHRAEACKTGSGISTAPVLTPTEQKVKEMILSVEGNECCFDSDFVVPSNPMLDPLIIWSPAEEHNITTNTTEQTLRDGSSIFIKIESEDSEPPRKKVCNLSQEEEEELVECKPDITDPVENKFKQRKEWNPTTLKHNRRPVFNRAKEKRPFDKLTEEKIEIAKIQKQIVTEELQQKLIQRKIVEKDLEHKAVMHQLEKQHLLLKIELLKKDLIRNGENCI